MIISVDIDGVCADTVPLMLQALNTHFGKAHSIEDCTDYSFEELYGTGAYEVLRSRFPEIFRSAVPLPGAAATLNRLASNGHRLVYITYRDSALSEITAAWLWRHYFPPGLLIHTDSKVRAVQDSGVNLAIDDNPTVAEELARYIPVLLFDYPYNRSIKSQGTHQIKRVQSWQDIEIFIHSLSAVERLFTGYPSLENLKRR